MSLYCYVYSLRLLSSFLIHFRVSFVLGVNLGRAVKVDGDSYTCYIGPQGSECSHMLPYFVPFLQTTMKVFLFYFC